MDALVAVVETESDDFADPARRRCLRSFILSSSRFRRSISCSCSSTFACRFWLSVVAPPFPVPAGVCGGTAKGRPTARTEVAAGRWRVGRRREVRVGKEVVGGAYLCKAVPEESKRPAVLHPPAASQCCTPASQWSVSPLCGRPGARRGSAVGFLSKKLNLHLSVLIMGHFESIPRTSRWPRAGGNRR